MTIIFSSEKMVVLNRVIRNTQQLTKDTAAMLASPEFSVVGSTEREQTLLRILSFHLDAMDRFLTSLSELLETANVRTQ